MDEDKLPPELREAIIDWFEGFELVELLGIDINDVIDAHEDTIIEHLSAIKQEMHWKDQEDESEE